MKKSEIETGLQVALGEIGPITPWWSEEDQLYVFEHAAYPRVVHGDTDKDKTIQGYLRALRRFIEYRLEGKLSPVVEKATSGRGGQRPGAGRRKGSVKPPSKMVRLPIEIAEWIKSDPAHMEMVRKLMA